ncbi:connector enhancer of kinase suppressor of ras 1 isoform X4 [Dendropsophus ebraccatus]|uniref:connector enhancer of kinase suppressor of ras 1 isoform X4 n=1 Tax=Dendropsophus ebraccatus TaxID=150705 RepID=UPI003831B5FD
MELISSWSPDTVRGYLEGLEPSVQHYPFQGWRITGQDLLDLSPQHLDALGVRSIGHQEVFLEAVEQLCALHYELHSETLRSLTDKLHGVSQTLCSHIRSLRKASSVSQSLCPTQKQLAAIIDIVCSARGLFSWLNRYLFTRLNDYSASRDVIALCVELAEVLHKDWSDPLIEDRILAICENICGICRSILHCSPESLLSQTATLQLVHVYPQPCSSLDRSRPRSGSDSSAKSTLGHLSLPLSPGVLRSSVSESNLINPTVVPDKSPGQEEAAAVNQQDKKLQKSPGTTPPSTERRAVGGATHSHKGSVTKLSRRRVSCKDLGRPDCDGWLWKRKENVGFMSQRWKRCWCVLKKDRLYWYSSAQDEKALGLLNISSYSLESPLEAKPKKKYEFQLSHPTYKPFVFAADNLSDMQKWVTFLLKALQKYKAPPSTGHSQEEDCYSETEAEDDDVRSHDAVKKPLIQSPSRIAPVPKVGPSPEGADGGHLPLQAEGGHSPQPIVDDDLKLMMTCLKQGGVSLIGKKTAMTRDEYRKSFIRRNKNPDINQKAHTLRVLQSTLKAKLLELQSLDQILDNPGLNSNLFQRWKSEHEHLYGSLGMSPPAQRAAASNTCPEKKNDRSPRHSRESEESD